MDVSYEKKTKVRTEPFENLIKTPTTSLIRRVFGGLCFLPRQNRFGQRERWMRDSAKIARIAHVIDLEAYEKALGAFDYNHANVFGQVRGEAGDERPVWVPSGETAVIEPQ